MNAPKHVVWVMVADEAIARFLVKPDGADLEPVHELTDPAAHARTSSTPSAGEDPQHLEAGDFAKQVATYLSESLRQKKFDELHVAAAPRFLGLLRKAQSAQVQAVVAKELNKDLIHESNREITLRMFGTDD